MSKVQVETYDFNPRFSETVLSELDRDYSRRTVKLAATEKALPFGMVLAKDAAGSYTPFSGEGNPAGILISEAGVSGEAQEALVLTGYCIVNANGLQWDDSVTDKKAAIEALESRGIIVKEA